MIIELLDGIRAIDSKESTMTGSTSTAIPPRIGTKVHLDSDHVPTRWLQQPEGEMWQIIDPENTLVLTRIGGTNCELSIKWPGGLTTALTIPRTDFTSEFFQAA
jgi:hypothetical protein